MTTKDNGAPAFPITAGHEVYATGLSARDWFAGMALQGVLASDGTGFASANELAAAVYEIADAVLAEREKRDD